MFNSSKGLGSAKGPGDTRDILLGPELCWDGPQGCTCASKAVKSKGKKVQRASQCPDKHQKRDGEMTLMALICSSGQLFPGHSSSHHQ